MSENKLNDEIKRLSTENQKLKNKLKKLKNKDDSSSSDEEDNIHNGLNKIIMPSMMVPVLPIKLTKQQIKPIIKKNTQYLVLK